MRDDELLLIIVLLGGLVVVTFATFLIMLCEKETSHQIERARRLAARIQEDSRLYEEMIVFAHEVYLREQNQKEAEVATTEIDLKLEQKGTKVRFTPEGGFELYESPEHP
jgi:hypothetical protein